MYRTDLLSEGAGVSLTAAVEAYVPLVAAHTWTGGNVAAGRFGPCYTTLYGTAFCSGVIVCQLSAG